MLASFVVVIVLLSLIASTRAFRPHASLRLAKRLTKSSSLVNHVNTRTVTAMMAGKTYNIGIVGATGAVGEEILSVMTTKKFPVGDLKLFASEKSAGIVKKILFFDFLT